MGTLVTKADTVAAKGMLDHAFRNAGPRALRDVAFGDIALAFAHHRHAETAELVQACSDLLGPLVTASKAMQADGRVLDDNAQAVFDRARAAIARATGAGA